MDYTELALTELTYNVWLQCTVKVTISTIYPILFLSLSDGIVQASHDEGNPLCRQAEDVFMVKMTIMHP